MGQKLSCICTFDVNDLKVISVDLVSNLFIQVEIELCTTTIISQKTIINLLILSFVQLVVTCGIGSALEHLAFMLCDPGGWLN